MPESPVDSAEPLRVLFADDDEAARALLRVMLELVDGVEIVGEARDGLDAVLLAQETEPQLVILDVRMPRLDGIAAAEALWTANPAIQLILHTSEPDSDRLREAERLGIQINDKADPDGLVRQLEAAAAESAETPSAQNRLQAAVLAALVGSVPGQGLVVSAPNGEIPFYNQAAAEFLDWPFPPQAIRLGEAREAVEILDATGRQVNLRELPMSRALATRRPIPERAMVVVRQGVLVPIITGATPLFDHDGDFIGVASHFRAADSDLDGVSAQTDLPGLLERRVTDQIDRDGSGQAADAASHGFEPAPAGERLTDGARRGRRG